jgi:hypothetical protein
MVVFIVWPKNLVDIMEKRPSLVRYQVHWGVLSYPAKVIHEYIHVRDCAFLDYIFVRPGDRSLCFHVWARIFVVTKILDRRLIF